MDCVPKQDVLLRLRKIEGQVRGLQRMIEEEKECASIVHQLCAVRKALDKVGFLMLTGRLRQCAGQDSIPRRQRRKLSNSSLRLLELGVIPDALV